MTTALITGASRGIGKAAAKRFAKSGWDLLLTARDAEALQELSNELKVETASKIAYKSIDLSNPDILSSELRDLLKMGSCPSVLINNAGVAWTGEMLSMPISQWQWLIQMNVTSIFQVCSEVVPLMRLNGGLVINVSSHAARNAFPQWGAYCVSKAALASFTKCLAEEERIHSIRACTLTLGAVNTTLWDSETVESDFNRNAMLSEDSVAEALFNLAQLPPDQVIEDLTLMPANGAF